MKRICSLFLGLTFGIVLGFGQSESADDPVIMKINGKDIRLSEFNYIWQKNNTGQHTASVDEYLDLFTVFKLKVAAAEEARLDTLNSFLDEWNGYRKQLVPAYLTDKEAEEAVLEETYQMMKTYVEASHILIMVDQYAPAADTLAAYRKALDIRKKALRKGGDFAALAKSSSEDESNRDQGGYLGTTVASRYIYPFAKSTMSLKEGEISMPVRSPFGYHLIKLHKRIEIPGLYESGHIFKAAPEGSDTQSLLIAKDAIDRAYQELVAGTPFNKVATQDNDDQAAKENDGNYPLLRPGQMPYDYEREVFALNDGEYSKPFQTEYGWHIVKRNAVKPYPAKEPFRNELMRLIQSDSRRALAGQRTKVEQLKKEYGFVCQKVAWEAFCQKVKDYGSFDEGLTQQTTGQTLATFSDQILSDTDFARFLCQGTTARMDYLQDAWERFTRLRILSYEDSRLEQKYPDFGYLMQEYHDGLLLFEISNQEVWNKATDDTTGLLQFFADHKDNYTWDVPHYKGSILMCSDGKTAKKVRKAAKKLSQEELWPVLNEKFNSDTLTRVRIEKGLFSQGETAMVDKVVFGQGDWTAPEAFPVVWPQGEVLDKAQELDDVRGAAIADYQNYLEELWIKSLRQKYPVTIYQQVVDKLRQ